MPRKSLIEQCRRRGKTAADYDSIAGELAQAFGGLTGHDEREILKRIIALPHCSSITVKEFIRARRAPTCELGFHSRLAADFGMTDAHRRDEVVGRMRERFAGLDEALFWGEAFNRFQYEEAEKTRARAILAGTVEPGEPSDEEDGPPTSEMQFLLRLMHDAGLTTEQAAAAAEQMRGEFPVLYLTDPERFWGHAFERFMEGLAAAAERC